MRAVVVDLLCNSPFYCSELTRGLRDVGVAAKLASPRFYLEPGVLDACPRPRWIVDVAVHVPRPRPLRLVARAFEGSLNFACLLAHIQARDFDVVHVQSDSPRDATVGVHAAVAFTLRRLWDVARGHGSQRCAPRQRPEQHGSPQAQP